MKTRGLLVLLLLPACVPSRAALFDPVRQEVRQRTGIDPVFRDPRSTDHHARVLELLVAPLTADSAALIAVLNNAALQAAYQELGVAGGALAAARTPANPEVEGALRFPLDDGGRTQIELVATEDLTSLLAALPRAAAAGADLDATRREVTERTVELAARARVLLYESAAADARRDLRRSVAEAAGASATLARKLREAGNISELDLLRETLFEEDAAVALRAAESDARAAYERLSALLGGEIGWRIAEGVLTEAAPAGADVANLERQAVAASLELAAASARVEAAGGRIDAARVESFVPRLGVGVHALRESEGWHAGPAVTLSLPLFDWGQGRRAAAGADLRRRQHALVAVRIEVITSARVTRERVQAAEERLARIEAKLLPLRQQLMEESVKQYNAMRVGPFELLQIRRQQIEIEERHLDALRDAWIARTEAWQLRAGSRPGKETP